MSLGRKPVNIGSINGERLSFSFPVGFTTVTTSVSVLYDTYSVVTVTPSAAIPYNTGDSVQIGLQSAASVNYTYLTDVLTTFEINYSDMVEQTFDIVWGIQVESSHSINWSDLISKTFSISVHLAPPVEETFSISWDLDEFTKVQQTFEIALQLPVYSQFTIATALTDTAQEIFSIAWDLNQYTKAEQTFDISWNVEVAASFDINYAMTTDNSQLFALNWPLTVSSEQTYEISVDLPPVDALSKLFKINIPLESVSTDINTNLNTLTVNGIRVKFDSYELSQDFGSALWSVNVLVSDPESYSILVRDTLFTLTINGDVYEFIVDSRNSARQFGNRTYSITGVSPTNQYDDQRGTEYSKEWPTTALASEIATYNIDSSDVQWNIIDWAIPGNVFSVENGIPLQILSKIASAAGALVYADKDGTLLVEYEYKKQVNQLSTLSPDHDLNYTDHLYTINESESPKKLYNNFRIMNEQVSIEDRLEKEDIEGQDLTSYINAYIIPWRDPDNFTLENTGYQFISIWDKEETTRVITDEIVTVLDGAGNTQYPVDAINSYTFESTDLGSVTVTAGTSKLRTSSAVNQYGLIKLTYTTRYLRWKLRGSEADLDPALLLLKESI